MSLLKKKIPNNNSINSKYFDIGFWVTWQASPRGGTLMLHMEEESHSVIISGEVVTAVEGLFVA